MVRLSPQAGPERGRSLIAAILVGVAACLSGIAARAADDPPVADPPGEGGWIATVGGNMNISPRYLGAEIYGFGGLPDISFRKAGTPAEFSPPEDGLDFELLGDRVFSAGLVANIRESRYGSLDRQLRGLRSYPIAPDIGVYAQAWLLPEALRARVEVRQGLRDGDGTVADIFVDAVRRVGAFTLSAGPRMTFADASANRLEFGVSDDRATLNPAPAFHPSAGLRTVGLGAAVSYDWSPEWRTTLYYKYDRLVGDAAQSPIVRLYGSANQMTFGLGIHYSFRTPIFD